MALLDRVAKAGPNASEILPIPGTGVDEMPKASPFAEIGVSGLLRTKGVGYVYDEWLRDLGTHRQKMVYREMRDNDPVIGAMFFALEMILRKAEWRVEAAAASDVKKAGGNSSSVNDCAEFVESCIEDMSHTWEDFIAECVNMFAFGFSLFEVVHKRRNGPDGKKASKFDDDRIGWRKFAARSQESILYWIWDEEGGLQGAVQLAAPDYKTVPIPISSLLLFRTTSIKNNPEGRSILRNCYRPWFFKRRIEEIEVIGIERDLCGIPVLYASADAIDAMGGPDAAKRLVRNLRIDDQMGVVLPIAFDDNGNPLVKLELMKAAGAKQTDPNASIGRYNHDILNTLLAGFIEMGQTPTGSFSLHMSASQIFATAIGAFMDSIAAIVNRIAIPRLLALNKMDPKAAPKLLAGEIGVRDLDGLSVFVQRLSQSGLNFTDRPTENYLRKSARLPDAPEDGDPEAAPRVVPGMVPPGQPDQPGQPAQPSKPQFGKPGQPAKIIPPQKDPPQPQPKSQPQPQSFKTGKKPENV